VPHASNAAVRSDAILWRLGLAESQLNRELARGLGVLRDRELFIPLGSVRARDFVREHLGIEESRARWLVRLGRQLNAVPEIDQALAERRISASHAIELGAVIDPTTDREERANWIARAGTTSIREFRRLTHAANAAPEPEKEPKTNPSPIEIIDLRPGARPSPIADDDPDAPPAGGWMSIPAPARVAVLWHGSIDLARAAAGRHLNQGQCAEMIFAEYLSAVPPDPSDPEAEALNSNPEQREALLAEIMEAMNSRPPGHSPPSTNNREPTADQATASIGLGTGPSASPLSPVAHQSAAERYADLDWEIPALTLPEDCLVSEDQEPWQLAAALKRLSRLKQKLRYDLALELDRMHEAGHWHALGFASLAAYCEVRLDFGLRRAERLIRFKDGLDRFPQLREAYLEGRISYSAALLLLPILHRTTEAAWVRWADGITFRELERVTAYARTYALPDAHPTVLASWVRGLAEQGLAMRRLASDVPECDAPEVDGSEGDAAEGNAAKTDAPQGDALEADAPQANLPMTDAQVVTPLAATMFAGAVPIPLGYALPPDAPGALPKISGVPDDIALAPPELCIALIRFWLPADALRLAYRALQHCRSGTTNPLLPTWAALELILVHFIQTHDTPVARALARRHRIIARDNYQCLVPGCTSRCNLHSHHLEHQAQGGSDEDSNQATECFGHHIPGQHGGVIDMGGYAPDRLTTKLGINPRTGRALAYYRNERRVSEECAERDLAEWRAELRARRRERAAKNPAAEREVLELATR
jgi:hypothetical protein